MKVALHRILRQERWTSIDVYSDRLFRGLRELASPGWSFSEDQPPDRTIPPFRRPSLYLNRLIGCPWSARTTRTDLHHVLDNSYGHLLYALDSHRTVVTSHGGTPRTWRMWNQEGIAMRFFDFAFSGMLKASRILIVSEYSKRELVEFYAYDPNRVHVVYHGIDNRFRPLEPEVRERIRSTLLQPDEGSLLLHVGHCADRKNVDGLLRAFGRLSRSLSRPIRLVQVGGEFSEPQRAIIANEKIEARITQISQFPNERLTELYNAADLFVFPSLYEGFGIPLIEAMASGTPVLCTDYELFREVCSDAARFVDTRDAVRFADAIAEILHSSELAQGLRSAGLDRAKRFRWEATAQGTLDVYRLAAEEAGLLG